MICYDCDNVPRNYFVINLAKLVVHVTLQRDAASKKVSAKVASA